MCTWSFDLILKLHGFDAALLPSLCLRWGVIFFSFSEALRMSYQFCQALNIVLCLFLRLLLLLLLLVCPVCVRVS
jgi:hypothetical protein